MNSVTVRYSFLARRKSMRSASSTPRPPAASNSISKRASSVSSSGVSATAILLVDADPPVAVGEVDPRRPVERRLLARDVERRGAERVVGHLQKLRRVHRLEAGHGAEGV